MWTSPRGVINVTSKYLNLPQACNKSEYFLARGDSLSFEACRTPCRWLSDFHFLQEWIYHLQAIVVLLRA